MPGISLTRQYDSLLTTTLDLIRPAVEDQISTGTKLLYFYKKAGNWKGVGSGGAKYAVPLMYELVRADAYAGYSQLDVTPFEGLTDAFFEWRQGASHVTISGLEEFQNRDADGTRIFDLLKLRTKQAMLGLEDFFSRGLMQGQGRNDGVSITTPYVSPINGASFLDPLPLLVKYDPTTSTVIGSINESTNPWWQNQTKDMNGFNSFAGLLKGLRNLYTQVSKGPGGTPDVHVTDLATFDLYETALAASHRNPDYQKADIPFESLQFKGKPVVAEEFTADAFSNTTAITTGTWYMLNTQFLGVTYDNDHNFAPGPFVRPENQDAKTAQVLWYGTHWCSNRRKQGVAGRISLAIVA
jgi:hypothetical protein